MRRAVPRVALVAPLHVLLPAHRGEKCRRQPAMRGAPLARRSRRTRARTRTTVGARTRGAPADPHLSPLRGDILSRGETGRAMRTSRGRGTEGACAVTDVAICAAHDAAKGVRRRRARCAMFIGSMRHDAKLHSAAAGAASRRDSARDGSHLVGDPLRSPPFRPPRRARVARMPSPLPALRSRSIPGRR